MTHIDEDEFREQVADDLSDLYDPSNVHQLKRLAVSQRIVDIFVETPDDADDIAIEVENDFEAVFEGVGQATLYGHQLDAQRVILVPVGHVEYPEAFYLAACGIHIFQYPIGE